ncbi:MAG: type I secretion system permease/ATPase [Limnohabitans sp.]
MKPQASSSELSLTLLRMRKQAWWVFGLTVAVGVLSFTSTVYMLQVYDRVVTSHSLQTLASLTVMALLAYGAMELLEKVRSRLMWSLGVRLDLALSPRVYRAMMQAWQMGITQASSALQDVRTLREFAYHPMVTALFDLPVALVSMILIFMIQPWLGAAALVGGLTQVLLAWATDVRSRPPLMEAQKRNMLGQQFAEASLRHVQVMRGMGMLPAVMAHWQVRQLGFLAYQAQGSLAAATMGAASKLVQQLLSSVLLGLAALALLNGSLNGGGGMLIIGSVLGGRMLQPLTQLVQGWTNWVGARGAWQRLEQLLQAVPTQDDQMALPRPVGELRVQGLLAGPPQARVPTLQGVSFEVKPGHVLAVVGPSGSGKSTLSRVLVGAWPAMQGSVRLDGADVWRWNKDELGPALGYLPQGVELLEGTLAENMARFGKPDAQQLAEVVALTGLGEWLASLPQGIDTPVGVDGVLLSGGQRQRVALARALYGNPALVVLDEPNASLDEMGERALVQAIAQRKAQGTAFVVVTHRSQLLAVADELLVLDQGIQRIWAPRDEALSQLRGETPPPGQMAQKAAQGGK